MCSCSKLTQGSVIKHQQGINGVYCGMLNNQVSPSSDCNIYNMYGLLSAWKPCAVDGQPFVFTFYELREFIDLERPKVCNCTVLVAYMCSSVITN